MSVSLRPYQLTALERTRAHVRAGKRRVVVCAPTGSGKTSIAAATIQSATRLGKRSLFLAHRKELLDQCQDRLAEFGVTASIVRADDPRIDPENPVQVASIQTLARRLTRFGAASFDLVIVDEAHHARADTYEKVLGHFSPAAVIGLTATPCRKDGRGLAEMFDALVEAATLPELIAAGFLVPIRMFVSPRIDLSGVHIRSGDYAIDELGERMASKVLVGNIITEWKRLASDRQTVVFATTIAHSESIRDRFLEAGIVAEHLDGETPEDERAAILARVRSGETRVICNCQILTEGWDEPRISACVLARPTKSVGLFLQMAGRVLRPSIGKSDCIILDHANNYRDHGAVDEDRSWTLTGDRPVRAGEAPSKECPECHAVVAAGSAVCPECSHVFVSPVARFREDAATQLVEVSRQAGTRRKRKEFFRLVDTVRHARKADGSLYKPTAAVAKYREQFGEWPRWSWQEEAGIR